MKKNYTILILILCIFFLSCKKISKPDVEPIIPDIYLCGGAETSVEVYTAQYWKNNKVVDLITSPDFPTAVSIAVSGSDVHVLGQGTHQNGVSFGHYWKNGILTAFTKNLRPSYVTDMVVSGQDVYIAGSGLNDSDPKSKYGPYATYWKNGEAVVYPNAYHGWAEGIFLSGNDVYLAGRVFNGYHDVARYWKNGDAVTLGKDSELSSATAIAVSGNNVNVVGWGGDTFGPFHAKYWKNGVEAPLTDHSEDYSTATDIAISGNDVYILVQVRNGTTNEAKIWKNGVLAPLPFGIYASSIFLFNNDVYVTGAGNGTPNATAIYWKNGTPTFLSDGTKHVWLSSIFVKNP